MKDDKNVDIDKYLNGVRHESGGRAQSECTSRMAWPQRETRPQSEKERFPDYFQRKQKERER